MTGRRNANARRDELRRACRGGRSFGLEMSSLVPAHYPKLDRALHLGELPLGVSRQEKGMAGHGHEDRSDALGRELDPTTGALADPVHRPSHTNASPFVCLGGAHQR